MPALLEDRRQAGMIDERNRVARNLHDTIKQDLFSVFLTAETLEKNLKIPDSDRRMVSEIKTAFQKRLRLRDPSFLHIHPIHSAENSLNQE